MSKFKVGDRVLATDNLFIHKTPSPGTIVEIHESWVNPYAVEYDDHPGSRWWSTVHDKIKQPVIVITSDGKTTTATKRLGKKVVCTATARCSDNDTFDFNTGAELAFQRLREKEKPVPKFYNGKVVCVESAVTWWTPGKIYEVKDGFIRDNRGDNQGEFRSFEHLNACAPSVRRFIPLVED